MSEFTREDLVRAATNICRQFADSTEQLNDLDSRLGDGDLGTTLAAISEAMRPRIDSLPNDVGACFVEIANTIAATSGSSFSAITMFGLLKAASHTKGRTTIAWSEVPELIDLATAEMSRRGGADIGDKTILDGLADVSQALRGQSSVNSYSATAKKAAKDTLAIFRDKPSKIGRARVAGDRNVGADDPGMFALHLAIEAL